MVRICKDGKKKYKSLGVSVNPKHWNFERNTLKTNCPNYEYLSKLIADKTSELSAEIVKLKSEHKEFTASTLSFLILLKFGLGCPFHHISERGMLAVCIVVGLILFCINPFIVIAFLKL